MPKVSPEFLQALEKAVLAFKAAKQYADGTLPPRFQAEVTIMSTVLANTKQNDRQLRDNLLNACAKINSNWRNWVVGSLLVDYIRAVIADYPVELLHEKTCVALEDEIVQLKKTHAQEIERLNSIIGGQGAEIERLKNLVLGVQTAEDADALATLRDLLEAQSRENIETKTRIFALINEVDAKSKDIADLLLRLNKLEQENAALKKRLIREFTPSTLPPTKDKPVNTTTHQNKHFMPDSPIGGGSGAKQHNTYELKDLPSETTSAQTPPVVNHA